MSLRRAELDAIRFPVADMDALVAAIDVNDRIDLEATLPTSVTLDYPTDRLVEGFRLSRQLWQEGFDRPAMLALAGTLRDGGQLDEERRAWFKQVRARFKHLRFAFYLYSAAHRCPRSLALTSLVMGELQDSVRVRGPADVRRHAGRLRLLLTGPAAALLMRDADRFQPSDPGGFRRFTASQIASLRPLLAGSLTGAHAFHAGRKVVSRQVSFHDDMRTLYPSDEHRGMAGALATINGLMGQFHDALVASDAAGHARYRDATFALPTDIRIRLEALVDLYLGTSSSESFTV